MLGEFSKTGGAVVVETMLTQFARRFSAEFGPKTHIVAPMSEDAHLATPVGPAAAPPSSTALSAPGLVIVMLRHALLGVGRWMGRLLGFGARKL